MTYPVNTSYTGHTHTVCVLCVPTFGPHISLALKHLQQSNTGVIRTVPIVQCSLVPSLKHFNLLCRLHDLKRTAATIFFFLQQTHDNSSLFPSTAVAARSGTSQSMFFLSVPLLNRERVQKHNQRRSSPLT